jgi:hypothetical protein
MHRVHNRRTCLSIVQNVLNRSVTGHMPPVVAHVHADTTILLWKRNHIAGCFQHCIVRYTVDEETYLQLRKCMQCFGKPNICAFGHTCVNNCYAQSGECHTYVENKKDRHSLQKQWVRDDSGLTCRCPVISSLGSFM